MAEIVIMPKLGFNMSEGKLVSWYKGEGDPVQKGDPIFSIETDKTAIDIESTAEGIFRKKFIDEGDSVEVTLPIAIIGGADENIDSLITEVLAKLGREGSAPIAGEASEVASEPTAEITQLQKPSESAALAPEGRMKITPRARRAAAEKGLNLAGLSIPGTGYDGGICEKDILNYLETAKVKASPLARKMSEVMGVDLQQIEGSGANGKVMKKDVDQAAGRAVTTAPTAEAAPAQSAAPEFIDGKEIKEIVPYSGVRKIIGERLAQSKFTAPHLYFTQKVNLEKLLDLRTQINGAQEKKTSVTDYIARAVIKTLQKYPEMNSSLIGDKIYQYKSVNLGIAVAAPTGLIVPVIKEADHKSVVELSGEASVLFDKARNGKLKPEEYTGGTFTISNLGMFGIENFTAIINPPEVGILAVSATKDEPLVVKDSAGNKTIEIKPMMNITLTVDHRLIDGLLAAQFVTEIKKLLEDPIKLLV